MVAARRRCRYTSFLFVVCHTCPFARLPACPPRLPVCPLARSPICLPPCFTKPTCYVFHPDPTRPRLPARPPARRLLHNDRIADRPLASRVTFTIWALSTSTGATKCPWRSLLRSRFHCRVHVTSEIVSENCISNVSLLFRECIQIFIALYSSTLYSVLELTDSL